MTEQALNNENAGRMKNRNEEQGAPEAREKLLRLLSGEREEQRQAITSLEKLTVVSAGAGTGKTHTLARRFAWLLASDPDCRVEQILTLTFTHLAANEMRERIKHTLIKWRDSDPALLGRLDDAVQRIDEAYISTIHAFALRVIRESGLDLDIDPGSSLIGDAAQREFWEGYRLNLRTADPERVPRLSDEWRARVKEHVSSADYIAFLNYFGADTLSAIARESGDVFGSMSELPGDFLANAPAREESARKRIIKLLSRGWLETSDLWHGRIFPAIDGELGHGGVFADNLLMLRNEWPDAPCGAEDAARFASDLLCGALKSVPGKSGIKDIIEDVLGEKLTDWKKRNLAHARISETLFASPPYKDPEAKTRKMLLLSAAAGWECWNTARRASGGLTYADLVRYATRVLASGAYAGKFRHVMVDEFQDTDGLQNEMIKALASGGSDCTVFLVGDIKQSIYRFRHAEPKLFGSYMERPDACCIPLSRSYRMSGAMMDAINTVFGHIWEDGVIAPDGPGVPAPRCEPLLAPDDAQWWSARCSKNVPPEPSPLEIMLYGEDEDQASGTADVNDDAPKKTSLGEKRKILAAGLARRLNALALGKEEIWDKESMSFRPVAWGDIAILVPGRGSYAILEEALEEADIPAVFESGREYFKRGEVRDMINLLRALDDPDDDFAFAGWAESPLSGVAPGISLELAASGEGDSSLWQRFSQTCPHDASRFMKLRRRARLTGSSSALRSLLEDTSWLAAYKPGQRRRLLANVLRGIEIAEDYESSFGTSLSECADYLGRAMRGGFPAEEPPSADEGNFVQVKTVHASKGQEFPIVAIFGMESAIGAKPASRAAVSRHLGIVAKTVPPAFGALESPDGSVTARWHNIFEKAEEGEEKERLLYVAMTRAKDRLICCGAGSEKAHLTRESWLGWLLLANSRAGGPFPISFSSGAMPEGKKRARVPEVAAETCPSPSRPAAMPLASLASISATAYSLFMWCPAAYRIKYRQGRELKWELPDGDAYGGADLGSLAHWALSRWDMTPEGIDRLLPPCDLPKGGEERLKRSIPAFLRPVFSSKGDREALRSWLFAFAATEECSRLRELAGKGTLRRELAFRVPFAGANLAGSIDLYWEDRSGMHVRDWKITQAERAPDELYREQVNFYSLVCRIASRPLNAKDPVPVDAGLIYLRPAGGHDACAVWSAGESDATERNVRNVIKAAASGPFAPAEERCRYCPFSHACLPGRSHR